MTGTLIYALGYVLAILSGVVVAGWFVWQYGMEQAMPELMKFYCEYTSVCFGGS